MLLWNGNVNLKTKTNYRVSLHSKSEKQYKDSCALHLCDKQLSHLVTPRQRHESDRGDSIVSKVESTLLGQGLTVQGKFMKWAASGNRTCMIICARCLIISKVLREKDGLQVAHIERRKQFVPWREYIVYDWDSRGKSAATFPNLVGSVKSRRAAWSIGPLVTAIPFSIQRNEKSNKSLTKRHSNRKSQSYHDLGSKSKSTTL